MHRIQITHASQLPVAALFDALADHGRLGKVFGAPVRRIRDGDTEPNGVGSVRRIGFGPLAVEETVTAFERNRSIDYRITRGGFPIRDHRGHVAFAETGSGSRVDWTIEFGSHLPGAGAVLAFLLERAIRMGLKRVG
jgi:hypothetical protein